MPADAAGRAPSPRQSTVCSPARRQEPSHPNSCPGRGAEVDEACQQRPHLDSPEARDAVPAGPRHDTDRDARRSRCLPSSRTREFVRGLLIEHDALPQRDLYRTRYEEWSRDALDRLTDPVNRDVIRRYIRWQHQRRMNQMDQVAHGTFLRSKQTVTVAIDFLNWLTDHGIELGELEQQHLNRWQATGPSTRLVADRFLGWAIKTRVVRPALKIQRHRRGTSPRMSAIDQEQAVNRVVHTDELTARDRAAAILVLVFGQLSWPIPPYLRSSAERRRRTRFLPGQRERTNGSRVQ